ncbi:MAG TPA: SWIM zinc finger family protein [Mycobacteriales bacterium]|nr:SWIM zinc finger family protein [Mycobacteriales bacterium]
MSEWYESAHRLPAPKGPGARRPFGTTWWGRAWIDALETRSGLDAGRLSRGRSYARSGAVRTLDVAPGSVTASVQGGRAVPYETRVTLRAFRREEWERVLDVVSARIAHAAALLDGELPQELVTDVGDAGVSLLPEPGELRFRCTCPDWGDPCKHASAVCFLVADLLDNDPFELLLLRGRTRDEVLEALRARRSGGAAPAAESVRDDVDAAEAFAREPAPLPDLPLPPARPGRPAPLVGEPPAGSVRATDLEALAADAALRAWELLTGAGDGGLGLTVEEDLARRAAALLGTKRLDRLAKRAGLPAHQLSRRAQAWARGGRAALVVLDETWAPDESDVAEAVAALGAGAHAWQNRVSDASDARQLRLGRDGRWYPFRRAGKAWELAGPPSADPAAAVATLTG